MMQQIQKLGQQSIAKCASLGQSGIFMLHILLLAPRFKKSFPLLVRELYFVGVYSLFITIPAALFVGMVIGLQGYNTLDKFAATAQLGQLVALSITRELGPVITALLFAGRAGSALTAEIGLMKATEQLSSMEVMGVDPLWKVIFPRFWAGTIAMPLLVALFSIIAIYGGYLIGVQWLGLDPGVFWNNMQASVNLKTDIMSGMIKSVLFGWVITWIAVYQGFAALPTASGVASATTRTVVYSSIAILGLDFLLTMLMIGDW